MYHVTSVHNRRSILEHGLDPARMGAARGVAGSPGPEVDGCFLCRDLWEAEWFADVMNNTGGADDVCEVDATDLELVEAPEGYLYHPGSIPRARLRLVEQDRGRRR
jgi:hypothetical protein